ncbi:MAG: TetR/AcrR family transcriptional regulator [Paracoccaceae bacterium]
MTERRPYRREAEDKRREALIAAALELIKEEGPQAATVRAIADRAGVTAGLIRHYFQSKEALTREAFRALMDTMTKDNTAGLEGGPDDPLARLAVFVWSSLRPPVIDPASMSLWASFLFQVRKDPLMREVHEATYLNYRNALQGLIEATGLSTDPARNRAWAIAGNALIDGLWLEGCALPDAFAEGELSRIGLTSMGAILGVNLIAALPQNLQDTL